MQYSITENLKQNNPKVVIIDDDVDFAESILDLLENYGFDVNCAHNQLDAKKLVCDFSPHIAFIDIRLDQDNGVDFLKYLNSEYPSIICIMITGHAGTDTAIEALRHQAYDYLHKPIQLDDLLNCLNRAIEKITLMRERDQALDELMESEERFRVIADTSPMALLINRISDGQIVYVNKQTGVLFNTNHNDLIGNSIAELFGNTDECDEIIKNLRDGKHINGQEILLKKADNTPIWVSLTSNSIFLQGEEVICNAILDITEAFELSRQLSYHAAYDSLTGLINRHEFEIRLNQVIKNARQENTENALCYLDLDQFKVINDTCGHVAGDELLRQLGQVLQTHIRKQDTLARLGGDEFAVLVEDCPFSQAERVANAIRLAIQDFRFVWEDTTFNIGVSIGMVPIIANSDTLTDILKRADSACYAAKDKGRNRVHIFHPDDEELAQRHGEMKWVARINSALEQNRLSIWSQKIIPINALKAGEEHYEMLLRMEDEKGNIILPGAFLPAAERYNLATHLDYWMVNTIFDRFSRHQEEFDRLTWCSLNLSGQSLCEEDFLQYILDYFDNSSLAPHKFCFEITETSAIANLNSATHFIKTLKERGCRFALDDFGSGLSSFAYLKNLPIDYLKIDGMFVKDILDDPIDLAMVKSINDVCHVMGKEAIAEFVENDEILEILKEIGVDYAQGNGIEEPRPLAACACDTSVMALKTMDQGFV